MSASGTPVPASDLPANLQAQSGTPVPASDLPAGLQGAAGGVLHDIGFLGRAADQGIVNAVTAVPDALTRGLINPAIRLANRILGTNAPQQATLGGDFSRALDALGTDRPQTPGQQLASQLVSGATGALTGAALGGGIGALGQAGMLGRASAAAAPLARASTLANLGRAGLAGATGGLGAGIAQQAGGGPTAQLLTGLAGAAIPGALEGIGSGVNGIARALTRAGQAQRAANVLTSQTLNPQAAATALESAQELVPGSARTSGEASGDQGLLGLHKAVRGRNVAPFAELESQQNSARQSALTQLGGTEADIAAAEAERDAETAPMREQAFANGSEVSPESLQAVHGTIKDILKSPAGARESIGKTMRWADNLIGTHTDPETLYEVRKDLALAQQSKLQPSGRDAPNESMLAQARGQLGKVIGALDDAIEEAAPGYVDYLDRYHELSEPIDQMEAIQALQGKASSGLDTATGQPFLHAPQFARQLRNTLSRTGPSAVQFTPEQTARLQALREDLQRGAALSQPNVRAPGSDTFQNFMAQNALSRAGLGAASHLPGIDKIAQALGRYTDRRVNEQLTQAMLNPATAARLLRLGVPPAQIPGLAANLAQRAVPAALGPTAALQVPTPLVPFVLPESARKAIRGRKSRPAAVGILARQLGLSQ